MLTKPIFTYLGVFLALVAILSGVFNWMDPELVWGFAGIFGFGSIAALRSFIKSKGWMTYVVAGIPMVAGLLLLMELIDIATYQAILTAFAPLTAATLQWGLQKSAK